MTELTPLAQALCSLKEDETLSLIAQMKGAGASAMDILSQCHQGMTELGRRFDQGDCFIPELILAGKIMDKVVSDLEPLLKDAPRPESAGCVVMGTVQNDIHNIGKDIVVMMLRGSGYDVIDLGINVSPEKFVQAAQENKAMLVGMSVLLTTCYKSVAKTVEAFKAAGLREKISIMLGGAAASDRLSGMTGCDYYGRTPVDAVNHAAAVAKGNA